MFKTRLLLKVLVLAAITFPMAANQGGCASPSGRSCLTVRGEILGQTFEVQWEVEWGPEVSELPTGSVYLGTANGMPIYRAPNGDIYVQFPGESGYRKIEGEIPPEIQDLIDQHESGDDEDDEAHGNTPATPNGLSPANASAAMMSPEPLTQAAQTEPISSSVPMTAPSGCGETPYGIVTLAMGDDPDPTFQVLADFDVDLDADWAQIEFTATLPDPDTVALIGTLDDLFVITLTIDTDEADNTITLGIEGSIDEVAKSLFVLGLEEMHSDAGALGEAEILFDTPYSVVIIKLDGTIERIIPVRVGTD